MSGDRDTNPNDSSLANFPEAEAQGSTRLSGQRRILRRHRQKQLAGMCR